MWGWGHHGAEGELVCLITQQGMSTSPQSPPQPVSTAENLGGMADFCFRTLVTSREKIRADSQEIFRKKHPAWAAGV